MLQISIIIIQSILPLLSALSFPIAFTVVRNINQPLTLAAFFKRTGCCTADPLTNIPTSYNLVSLDGFTSTSTLDTITSSASPLSIWANAFSAITAAKDSIAGNTNDDVQNYILKQYHKNASILIFNALSNEAPISELAIQPAKLAQNIISVLQATQLEGVSIEFSDYHAVAKGTASDWLTTLLSIVKQQMPRKLIVLIIPPTFVLRVPLLQQPIVNSYVDLFVLKYYDTNLADYNTYSSLFIKSTNYPGTALMELLANPQLWVDTCKTLIAKPTSVSQDRTFSAFIDSSSLKQAFDQMYTNTNWFGGFANLDFEADTSLGFQLSVLQNLRNSCYSSGLCTCK